MKSTLIGSVLLLKLWACAAAAPVSPAPPAHVEFDSVDFKNVLRWTAPPNSSDVRYHVQWKIYGDGGWRDADGCRDIVRLRCDLSAETPDPREWYCARLRARFPSGDRSPWIPSPRFNPRWHTKISAPLLRLNASERGIAVRVRTPQPLAAKIQSALLRNALVYYVYLVRQAADEEVFEVPCCSGKFEVNKVERKSEYCFRAQSVAGPQGRRSARGAAKCITTL